MNMYSNISVKCFDTLPDDFRRDHCYFIKNNPRGFGYWLWKPAIILEKLRSMGSHEILVYADIGFTQNPNGRDRMIEYALIAQSSLYGLLSFMHPYTEYAWTKRDLAVRLGVADDLRIMATSQLVGGLIVLVPNRHTISLMEEWLSIAVEEGYRYLTDVPSRSLEDPRFIEHRHDQSIGSLLRKMRGTDVTFSQIEKFEDEFDRGMHSWPMIATRFRT